MEILQTEEYKRLGVRQKTIANAVLLKAKAIHPLYEKGKVKELFSKFDELYDSKHEENHEELNKWLSKVYGKNFLEKYTTHRMVTEIERRG